MKLNVDYFNCFSHKKKDAFMNYGPGVVKINEAFIIFWQIEFRRWNWSKIRWNNQIIRFLPAQRRLLLALIQLSLEIFIYLHYLYSVEAVKKQTSNWISFSLLHFLFFLSLFFLIIHQNIVFFSRKMSKKYIKLYLDNS